MNAKSLFPALVLAFVLSAGCGGVTPIVAEKTAIPLQKASEGRVLAENEGLRIVWEDAKDPRDFYRGGVQQKAAAESRFQAKAYAEALKLYATSNDFFNKTLQYLPEDTAEFPLYGETGVLFFPNLLLADNYLKLGLIQREEGHEGAAQGNWKKAQTYVQKSLQSEKTEWGLSLEKDIAGLLGGKKD